MTGIELIAAERQRQIEQEGWTTEHDDQHDDESLALVAALYATPFPLFAADFGIDDSEARYFEFMDAWPTTWEPDWDRRNDFDRRRKLVIAGALIAAELDRIDRQEESTNA